MKHHSRRRYAPLCGIFVPDSRNAAHGCGHKKAPDWETQGRRFFIQQQTLVDICCWKDSARDLEAVVTECNASRNSGNLICCYVMFRFTLSNRNDFHPFNKLMRRLRILLHVDQKNLKKIFWYHLFYYEIAISSSFTGVNLLMNYFFYIIMDARQSGLSAF